VGQNAGQRHEDSQLGGLGPGYIHHLSASHCKCVLIVPIRLRGIIPKVGGDTLKWLCPVQGGNTYGADALPASMLAE